MTENNLPIVSNKKALSLIPRNISIKLSDFSKRVGKVALGVGGLGAGIIVAAGAMYFSVPALPVIAFSGAIYSGVKGVSNIVYKKEPSLMFVTKKSKDGSRAIYQDGFRMPNYLRNISISDKACIMGLQTLIGFQRYKVGLRECGAQTIEANGNCVYEQTYSTITHSVNLNNLTALANAGYIEIVSEEGEFKHYPLSSKTKPLRSLLIAEKIGFSNTSGLKQIFKAVKSGDKEKLESLKETCKKVTFRLTDKDIDFEDIYKKINGYIPYESEDEQKKLKRLRAIFYDSNSRIPGVLSAKRLENKNGKLNRCIRKRKIDICYDRCGRPFLNYDARESFGERIERENGIIPINRKKQKGNSFEENLRKGVDLQKFEEISKRPETSELESKSLLETTILEDNRDEQE